MAPRKQAPKTQHSQNTGARILAAAERIFAEKGLKGARVNEIAELAQATPSLIHYHYGDKESLYKTVIENYYLGVERRLFPVLMEAIDPPAKLKKLIATGIDLLAEKDHMARILLRESLDNGKYVNEFLSKPYLREMFEMTEQMVFSKMEREEGSEAPRETRLFVVCHGAALRQELSYMRREIQRRASSVRPDSKAACPAGVSRSIFTLPSAGPPSAVVY